MEERIKDPRYGNRGMPFETFMEFACDTYKRKKIAVIDKQHTCFKPIRDYRGRVVNVKVEKKATVDFLGRFKNIPIAIEAKHTDSDVIEWNAVQEHQADYMDAFTEEPGTIGMVIVSFGLRRFFAIPWAVWKVAYDARVRSGAPKTTPVSVSAFGTTWDIPKKKSVRMEEIPPEYEISGNDRNYGLHFLQNAMQYKTPMQP